MCITEQRSGQPSIIRVYNINREDITKRMSLPSSPFFPYSHSYTSVPLSFPFFAGRDGADNPESKEPMTTMTLTGSKATVALWAPLSDSILTGHESGKIGKYDVKTGEEVNNVDAGEGHRGEITDIQLSPDGTYFITSSKDKTARVSLSSVSYFDIWIGEEAVGVQKHVGGT
jgi:translation initiation factor 3 subunit I